jgi:hypothetical protein
MQNQNTVVMTAETRMAALKQRATQQQGEVWQPSAGDTLFGIIAGSETTHHPIYGQQRLMLVQDENGGIVKVWMSKWLTDNLKAQDAQLNDLIALTFGGKHKTAQGREYNAYTLIVDKSEVAA